MRFKLDENFAQSAKEFLARLGQDASTVREEGLSGASDAAILGAAVREERILVTMDLDFADVLLRPPKESRGIAVLRSPGRVSQAILRSMLAALVQALERGEISGRLWIVEPGRIREHESDS
jgi:predicted nuclease of predicted toxin-antitoxin system